MKCNKYLIFIVLLSPLTLFAEQVEKMFPVDQAKLLNLENDSGDTQFTGGEVKQVTILAKKIKWSDNCDLSFNQDKTSINVVAKQKKSSLFAKDCQIHFTVSLPKTMDIDVKTGAGDVVVVSMESNVSTTIGSGDLSVERAQLEKLHVQNGSGDVKLKGNVTTAEVKLGSGSIDWQYEKISATGKAKIDSGSGDINIKMSPEDKLSELKIVSGSGDLKVDGNVTHGEIKTGSGDIDLIYRKVPAGNMVLKSGSGDATIKMPKESKIKVEFEAGMGKLGSDIVQDPNAPFSLSMSSGAGDLRIKTL